MLVTFTEGGGTASDNDTIDSVGPIQNQGAVGVEDFDNTFSIVESREGFLTLP